MAQAGRVTSKLYGVVVRAVRLKRRSLRMSWGSSPTAAVPERRVLSCSHRGVQYAALHPAQLTVSDDGVADLGRNPFTDDDGCNDDQQNERHLGPGEHGDRGVERQADVAGANQTQHTVDSRMLMSQRNTEMPAKAGMTCGTMP